MTKKITALGVIVIMLLMTMLTFAGCAVESDFSLTLTVSSDTFYEGEDIEVETVFKNLTIRRYLIYHAKPLILPYIVNQPDEDFPIYPNLRAMVQISGVIKRKEIRHNKEIMGSLLTPGEYELVADAAFSLRSRSDSGMRIISNSITITVLEKKS